jgi:Leucine-rich repeat (LRR) protein
MFDTYFCERLNDIKSNNPKITRISFPFDMVQPLNDKRCQILIQALKSNDFIKTLSLGSNSITREGLKNIWETKIEKLHISFMDIDEGVIEDLLKMQNLTELDIEGTKVNRPEQFDTLIAGLPNLKTLIIGSEPYEKYNPIEGKGLTVIYNGEIVSGTNTNDSDTSLS